MLAPPQRQTRTASVVTSPPSAATPVWTTPPTRRHTASASWAPTRMRIVSAVTSGPTRSPGCTLTQKPSHNARASACPCAPSTAAAKAATTTGTLFGRASNACRRRRRAHHPHRHRRCRRRRERQASSFSMEVAATTRRASASPTRAP